MEEVIKFVEYTYLNLSPKTMSQNFHPDSWDGSAASNVDGSDVGPWQTLNHAIEELRRIRPNPPTIDDQA